MGFRARRWRPSPRCPRCCCASAGRQCRPPHRIDARSGERSVPRPGGAPASGARAVFSTPARRKFLKTDATELAHCVEAVRRHALARPDVGFAIWPRQAGGPMAPARSSEQRLADVLGADFITEPPLRLDAGPLSAPAAPACLKAARSRQTFRGTSMSWPFRARQADCPCRALGLRDEICTAQRTLLLRALHRIDPERGRERAPTKIEVRFRDGRRCTSVRHAFVDALASSRRGPPSPLLTWPPAMQAQEPLPELRRLAPTSPQQVGLALEGCARSEAAPPRRRRPRPCRRLSPTPGGRWTASRRLAAGPCHRQIQGDLHPGRERQGLVVVDMHAAHERVVYERLKARLAGASSIECQPLLIQVSFAAGEEVACTKPRRVAAAAPGAGCGAVVQPHAGRCAHARRCWRPTAWSPSRASCCRAQPVRRQPGHQRPPSTRSSPPWPAMARCRQPPADPGRDERPAARHGTNQTRRPVQPPCAHLAPARHTRAGRPSFAWTMTLALSQHRLTRRLKSHGPDQAQTRSARRPTPARGPPPVRGRASASPGPLAQTQAEREQRAAERSARAAAGAGEPGARPARAHGAQAAHALAGPVGAWRQRRTGPGCAAAVPAASAATATPPAAVAQRPGRAPVKRLRQNSSSPWRRREADEWIEAGWVRVDGQKWRCWASASADAQIEIDPAARASSPGRTRDHSAEQTHRLCVRARPRTATGPPWCW